MKNLANRMKVPATTALVSRRVRRIFAFFSPPCTFVGSPLNGPAIRSPPVVRIVGGCQVRVAVLIDQSQGCRTVRLAFRLGSRSSEAVQLDFLSSWSELREAAYGDRSTIAVLQPCFGMPPRRPEPNFREIERATAVWDRETMILYLCCPHLSASLLHDLGRMGFPFLLAQGIDDDGRNILRMVARAEARRVLRERLGEKELPPSVEALRLILDAVAGWPPPSSVGEMARILRMSRRSLQRSLNDDGLPSPGKLVSYARLLEICTLWRMGIRGRARIASILGIADSSSLGHLSRSLTGQPLSHFLDLESGASPFDWFVRKMGA